MVSRAGGSSWTYWQQRQAGYWRGHLWLISQEVFASREAETQCVLLGDILQAKKEPPWVVRACREDRILGLQCLI